MKELYFVRHGLSVMNQAGIFSGLSETPLTELGKRQAREAGVALKSKHVDCIVSSPLSRALETAHLIAEQIGYSPEAILISDLFIERHFGPLEGTTYHPDLGDVAGVELIKNVMHRAKEGLTYIQNLDADVVVIVSHGAVGRALRHCLNPDIPFKPSVGFGNGEVVRLI